MTRAAARLGAVAAVIALLAGCAPAPQLPPAATQADLDAVAAKTAGYWWSSMFPDEPMPAIRVIAYVDVSTQWSAVQECIEAGLPGMTFDSGGMLAIEDASPQAFDAFQLAYWTCSQRFPAKLDDRTMVLTEAQLTYIHGYLVERLVPCLRLMGFGVSPAPDLEQFLARSMGQPGWNPYYELEPMPNQAEAWPPIEARCPPPPLAPELFPRGY